MNSYNVNAPVWFVHDPLWGDSGKGKVSDFLAQDERVGLIFRYQGGNNAGHTVKVGSDVWKVHVMPTGILHEDKICMIGNGVVIDPRVLVAEMKGLQERGLTLKNLVISPNAHLIMPYHVQIDHLEEAARSKTQSIGTTKRGIGPCYADKASRIGVRVQDAFDFTYLRSRIETALVPKKTLLATQPMDVLDTGLDVSDADAVAKEVYALVQLLKPYVKDTTEVLWDVLDSGKVALGEGAQGTMLDLDHGTYPFVTSSNCIPGASAAGLGIRPQDIGRIIGVVKAYPTRIDTVGPFPSKMVDDNPALDDLLIERGHEFGTTTGRRRRTGWNDIVALKHSIRLSGITEIAFTKMDVMYDIDPLKLCVAYEVDGAQTHKYPSDRHTLARVKPVYETFSGFTGDISGVRSYNDLPAGAREYVEALERLCGTPVTMVGVGMEREQLIVR